MKDVVQQMYQELSGLTAEFYETGQPPMNRLGQALRQCREVMLRLRSRVILDGFASEADEIAFFKYEKPKFVAEQLYLTELTMVFLGRPGNEEAQLKSYYEEEQKRLKMFINRFGFLYQCFQLDAGDLDSVLFLRDAGPSAMILPEQPVHDPDFSTAGDYLWAKFLAYDRLLEWIVGELRGLGGADAGGISGYVDGPPGPVLRWTGNTVNLAELAYGLWLTGQLNNGNVSVSEIVTWLERHLAIKVGDAHRRWQSIAARKRVGPFVFVDEMKAALVKRLDEEWSR